MLNQVKDRAALFALVILVLTQTTIGAAQNKRATPPSAKELVGVWIGYDSDELTFTRLDLRPDSTGFCARISPADTILHAQGVHTYRITKWTVKGWNIELTLMPISNAVPIAYARGRTGLGSLSLTIGGPENGGWKDQLLLQSESRMAASNREAQDAIEAADDKH